MHVAGPIGIGFIDSLHGQFSAFDSRTADCFVRASKMRSLLRRSCRLLGMLLVAIPFGPIAHAQSPKELRTRQGTSIAMVNLVNSRKDCSVNPGPIRLPSLRQPPQSGTVQLQIIVVDVSQTASCPARKLPALALIYTPRKDFTGVDTLQIELDEDNRTTLLSYRIVVGAEAQPL
jgi:hypothetical protein